VIESIWRWGLPLPNRPAQEPTQPPVQFIPEFFPEEKAAKEWPKPLTPSSAEAKERVEPYLFSPFWAFIVCTRVNLTLICVRNEGPPRRHTFFFRQHIITQQWTVRLFFIFTYVRMLYIYKTYIYTHTTAVRTRVKKFSINTMFWFLFQSYRHGTP
jgi:hypothetical protein